eukprot:CAMPEP_0197564002 /NCGR_PEP_ID=MMETSP1320-20131121/29712_1 /TAXON_ID=91990 /ORGANISM="Bolidomonas sp., Strain RCC2347" /LENGTH=54 /DNA_ID=CAMNT_0043125885 /DNA_START=13 /DNA_END=174 /DNA_ORIENTATION=-
MTKDQLASLRSNQPKVKVHLYAGDTREALGWATLDVRDLQLLKPTKGNDNKRKE